jgi:Fe2+ transport system protein FeoA
MENKMKLLSEFTIGERGVVKMVDGDRRIRRRLFDMGVTPGAEIMLRKKAPLGDPIEVCLRGYHDCGLNGRYLQKALQEHPCIYCN